MVSMRKTLGKLENSPAESFGSGESPFPPFNDMCDFQQHAIIRYFLGSASRSFLGQSPFRHSKACWVDDALRVVRFTEAKEFLTDVDTPPTVILQDSIQKVQPAAYRLLHGPTIGHNGQKVSYLLRKER